MRKIRKILVASLLFTMILFGYSLNAIAVCNLSNSDANKLQSVMENTVAYDNDTLNSIEIDNDVFPLFSISIISGSNYSKVAFNSDKFNTLQTDMQNVVLSNFQDAVARSSISSQGRQLIMSEIRQYTDFDIDITQKMITDVVQPDIFSGYEYIKPFSSVFGTIMGIVCIIIIFTLVFSTILDLMYIGFPTMKERMDDSAKNGKRHLDRPWYISYDAAHACKEALTSNEYKNAMLLYFKHRILTYIILALCLTYLMGGLFVNLLSWLLDTMNKSFGWSL